MKKFNIAPFYHTREANPFTHMCLYSLTRESGTQLSSLPLRLRNKMAAGETQKYE